MEGGFFNWQVVTAWTFCISQEREIAALEALGCDGAQVGAFPKSQGLPSAITVNTLRVC